MPQNQNYRCAECGENFTTRELLDKHNKQKHEEKAQTGQSAADSGGAREAPRTSDSSLSEE